MYTSREEVVFSDCLSEEGISLFRPITSKCIGGSQVIGCAVHSLYYGRSQRLRHIAYSERYDLSFGVCHFESIYLLGDVGKQVVVLQVEEMYVY